eukprot:scaffold2987_cov229-Prasinococcus_capsulatus_cf.AAC.1
MHSAHPILARGRGAALQSEREGVCWSNVSLRTVAWLSRPLPAPAAAAAWPRPCAHGGGDTNSGGSRPIRPPVRPPVQPSTGPTHEQTSERANNN